jgi:transcriptional/translational regulatory protein YebC/TACO1
LAHSHKSLTQKTNEPEKLHYETQNDNRDRSRGNKEGTTKIQPSHLEERGEEWLEQLGAIREGEQKLNATTTEEEMEIQQQRNQIHKVKEKIESTYYQATQIEIDKRP